MLYCVEEQQSHTLSSGAEAPYVSDHWGRLPAAVAKNNQASWVPLTVAHTVPSHVLYKVLVSS